MGKTRYYADYFKIYHVFTYISCYIAEILITFWTVHGQNISIKICRHLSFVLLVQNGTGKNIPTLQLSECRQLIHNMCEKVDKIKSKTCITNARQYDCCIASFYETIFNIIKIFMNIFANTLFHSWAQRMLSPLNPLNILLSINGPLLSYGFNGINN